MTLVRNLFTLALVGTLALASAYAQSDPEQDAAKTKAASIPDKVDAAGSSDTSLEDLVKLKQNPVSGLRQVILDVTMSPDVPVAGGTEASYSTQVVWPFRLTDDWKLITYTIVPVLQTPQANSDYIVGIGNTLLNFFVSPTKPEGNFV